MRCLRRFTVVVQSLLLLVLLTGLSTNVGRATIPVPAPTVATEFTAPTIFCAHCYDSTGSGYWTTECYDYESPTCRACPIEDDNCAGDEWFSQQPLCNAACNATTPALLDELDSAIANDDPVSLDALLTEHKSVISFNEKRRAIQVTGCDGESVIASLPVGLRVLHSLE